MSNHPKVALIMKILGSILIILFFGVAAVGAQEAKPLSTVFKYDTPDHNFRIDPFTGVGLPNGEDDETDGFDRFSASVQAESGSADPLNFLVEVYQALGFEIGAEVNNSEFGVLGHSDASLQYRLWPHSLQIGVPGFLYGVLGANLIRENRFLINGINDPDSGSTTLFFVPELEYVTKWWIVKGGVQIPVSQNLNETSLEKDYIYNFGFRLKF